MRNVLLASTTWLLALTLLFVGSAQASGRSRAYASSLSAPSWFRLSIYAGHLPPAACGWAVSCIHLCMYGGVSSLR